MKKFAQYIFVCLGVFFAILFLVFAVIGDSININPISTTLLCIASMMKADKLTGKEGGK